MGGGEDYKAGKTCKKTIVEVHRSKMALIGVALTYLEMTRETGRLGSALLKTLVS